jgi:hypothetical protein
VDVGGAGVAATIKSDGLREICCVANLAREELLDQPTGQRTWATALINWGKSAEIHLGIYHLFIKTTFSFFYIFKYMLF